jgi:hypothetical protein
MGAYYYREKQSTSKMGDIMRRTIWIIIATAAVASIIAVEASSGLIDSSRPEASQAGVGWEYLVVQGGTVNLSPSDGGTMRKEPGAFTRESFPLEKNLDKLGEKGWELVTVGGSSGDPIFYLKRRK